MSGAAGAPTPPLSGREARRAADDLQRRASDPARSHWVSASAGSGKTKVLRDRVLRLMLRRVPPERILCLTFTRAAAAEMSNRVSSELRAWTVLPDRAPEPGDPTDGLEGRIAQLTGAPPDEETLRLARRLFARTLDAPGGLKIQTIHGFCQSVLRRFPLEAGVAPHFEVMDDAVARETLAEARDRVLAQAAADPDALVGRALASLTGLVDEGRFQTLIGALTGERARLAALRADPAPERLRERLLDAFGLDPGETEALVIQWACADAAVSDVAALKRVAWALAQGSEPERARAGVLLDWLAEEAGRVEGFERYVGCFLTAAGTPLKKLANKATVEREADALDVLGAEALRLERVQERRAAAHAAEVSAALIDIGLALAEAYDTAKRLRARLDYDDLIERTLALLAQGVSWVMYKLDNGVDHILIDEAQDTNPEQWAVIEALAAEYFAGEGAREAARTIFAVGDAKQSIFSFQGADPRRFGEVQTRFDARARAVHQTVDRIPLNVSFRSTRAVLGLVDAVFDPPEVARGVADEADRLTVRHFPVRETAPGLVELWPAIEPTPRVADDPWTPPLDRAEAVDPVSDVARAIVGRVRGWIDRGETLPSRGTPIRPGDVMVLVRRRGAFVDAFVRACKDADIAVAGADRMILTEQLAVRDLMALGHFLLLPEDDLTLATVLKGPLVGLDEEALFDLAHGRTRRRLWHELRRREADFPEEVAFLSGLLAQADFAPPYELFGRVLFRDGGRRRILERLGPEAEDPIDEFLSQALRVERLHAPSLQGFLHWLETGAPEVKRDLEQSGRDEVRVMTVHGAKGLQAPIVFLPDTTRGPSTDEPLGWTETEGGPALPVWIPRAERQDPLTRDLRAIARRRRDEEYRRLLYVALTRAEDRLYVAGWRGRATSPEGHWHGLVEDALDRLAAADPRSVAQTDTGARIHAVAGVTPAAPPAPAPAPPKPPPAWLFAEPPPEGHPPRPLSPSRGEEEPPVRSPLGADGGIGFRRGVLIHRLLQSLPDLPEARWSAAAARFLDGAARDLAPAARRVMAEEALAVLRLPDFAPFLGPESAAEVPITGNVVLGGEIHVVSGRIDRLSSLGDQVHVIDYKTNRPPPTQPEHVASVHLRQMALYRALLSRIHPGKRVVCHLLWTDGPRLMRLPDAALDGALA